MQLTEIEKEKTKTPFCDAALGVIEIEATAVQALTSRIGANFNTACELLLNCTGRIVVLGMGKSGHIANKIAATLASTGTPAFFVHPGEASHGDLGMITKNDVVLALSHSGQTPELITLLPLIKRLSIPLISLTGNPQSDLAQFASVNLDTSVDTEACPLGLAPTSSTTVSLVMGDALAVALLNARGFTKEDFARSHPGGRLGRRLLVHVEDVMHSGELIPSVLENTSIRDALLEITQKGLGMTTVKNNNNTIIGIFTDGDLRRAIDNNIDLKTTPISTLMTTHYKTISSNQLAIDALNVMQDHKITALVVLDKNNNFAGVLHLHALLKSGVA